MYRKSRLEKETSGNALDDIFQSPFLFDPLKNKRTHDIMKRFENSLRAFAEKLNPQAVGGGSQIKSHQPSGLKWFDK